MLDKMEIKYQIGDLLAKSFTKSKPSFFLSNRAGSFYYHNIDEKKSGWYVNDNGLFQVLKEIRIAAPKVSEIVNRLFCVEQVRNKIREIFFMPFGKSSLVYNLNFKKNIDLIFDVRKLNDERKCGKTYTIKFQNGKTIIHFIKRSDENEDLSHGKKEFDFFIVLNVTGKKIGRWESRSYISSDVTHIYSAVKISTSHLVMSAGKDLNKCLTENDFVVNNFRKLFSDQRDYSETFTGVLEKRIASYSIDSLTTTFSTEENVLSNVPKFDNLTRDEIISLNALNSLGETNIVNKILLRQLRTVMPSGWLPESSNSNSKSLSSTLWLFKRLNEIKPKFSTDNNFFLLHKTVSIVDSLLKDFTKNGLHWDNENSENSIVLQSLRLSLYNFANNITKNSLYEKYEINLKKKVKELFWNGKILADGVADFTTKNNVFLAAYIYPNLLDKTEWKLCFKNILNKLWFEDGVRLKVGSNKVSFWMNNITAIALNRLDKQFYKNHISDLYNISKKELLWNNCVGGASEFNSEGSSVNLLSVSTFLELVNEIDR